MSTEGGGGEVEEVASNPTRIFPFLSRPSPRRKNKSAAG